MLSPRFASSGLRWRDARNGAPGVAIFVERLAAFLVFVGLSGLAVGGVGVSAAVSSYLSIKKSVIATLRSLGATNDIVFQVYFLQIACLSALGVFIGIILGVGLPILFAPMIDGALPFPIRIGVYGTAILQAGIYGVLMAVIFTLWPLAKIENIRATQLFRDMGETGAKVPASRYILAMFVLLGVLLACAAFFTGSLVLTLWSAFGIAVALVALLISALLMKRIAKWALVFAEGDRRSGGFGFGEWSGEQQRQLFWHLDWACQCCPASVRLMVICAMLFVRTFLRWRRLISLWIFKNPKCRPFCP